MKKVASLVLSIVLLLGTFSAVNMQVFADDYDGNTYEPRQLSLGENTCHNYAYQDHYFVELGDCESEEVYFTNYKPLTYTFVAEQEGLYLISGKVRSKENAQNIYSLYDSEQCCLNGFYVYLKKGESASLVNDPPYEDYQEGRSNYPAEFSANVSELNTAEFGGYVYDWATKSFALKTASKNTVDSTFCGAPVTKILEYAFADNSSITELTLPSTIEYIGDYAFAGCIRLSKVTVLNDFCKIGEEIFLGCPSKARIYDINGNVITGPCSHKYSTTLIKATFYDDGSYERACIKCGDYYEHSIRRINTVKLDKTSFVYDGKAKKPNVYVNDSTGKPLKNNKDYTVAYNSDCKSVGKHSVKIIFKGDYSGSRVLYYTVLPKQTNISNLKTSKKSLTVSWKKVTQVSGYQIQYSQSKSFKNAKTVNVGYKYSSKKISGLKAGKRYYVRIRTYKNAHNNKYYSSWNKTKNITIKK